MSGKPRPFRVGDEVFLRKEHDQVVGAGEAAIRKGRSRGRLPRRTRYRIVSVHRGGYIIAVTGWNRCWRSLSGLRFEGRMLEHVDEAGEAKVNEREE